MKKKKKKYIKRITRPGVSMRLSHDPSMKKYTHKIKELAKKSSENLSEKQKSIFSNIDL